MGGYLYNKSAQKAPKGRAIGMELRQAGSRRIIPFPDVQDAGRVNVGHKPKFFQLAVDEYYDLNLTARRSVPGLKKGTRVIPTVVFEFIERSGRRVLGRLTLKAFRL
ncbi:MAG: hypothetical protein HY401_07420 [Elusimicrobia bacterium]|nr:hypothetical protein [Elusimicrobiota bacterium]